MTPPKVVVTGTGILSSLANNSDHLFTQLVANASHVSFMPEWQKLAGLKCFLGAPVQPYDSKLIPRSARRTMSPMSEMALLATRQALAQADIANLDPKRTLICMGSTSGSPETLEDYFRRYFERSGPEGQLSTHFFKVMNHSVSSNVATGLGFVGPQLGISSACATSNQAIILGWEMIRAGIYDVVIAGGADELHSNSAAIFDNVMAASTRYNNSPQQTPRPFDRDRDGLVVSEGAGVLILESEEHARKRGAIPLAKILGGAYFCDGAHMTQPQVSTMIDAMEYATQRAGVQKKDIDYICAHGTATVIGDRLEAESIYEFLGDQVAVSSLKGHLGHSLAACGAIEAIACISMIANQTIIATRNFVEQELEAKQINLLRTHQRSRLKTVMSNNFAFGGINTSLILGGMEG